jgi:hypothetical protein
MEWKMARRAGRRVWRVYDATKTRRGRWMRMERVEVWELLVGMTDIWVIKWDVVDFDVLI